MSYIPQVIFVNQRAFRSRGKGSKEFSLKYFKILKQEVVGIFIKKSKQTTISKINTYTAGKDMKDFTGKKTLDRYTRRGLTIPAAEQGPPPI